MQWLSDVASGQVDLRRRPLSRPAWKDIRPTLHLFDSNVNKKNGPAAINNNSAALIIILHDKKKEERPKKNAARLTVANEAVQYIKWNQTFHDLNQQNNVKPWSFVYNSNWKRCVSVSPLQIKSINQNGHHFPRQVSRHFCSTVPTARK